MEHLIRVLVVFASVDHQMLAAFLARHVARVLASVGQLQAVLV